MDSKLPSKILGTATGNGPKTVSCSPNSDGLPIMSTPTASQDSHSTIPLTDEQREIWQEEERLIKAYQVLSNDSLAEGDPVRELAAETISTSSYQLKSIFDQDGNSIVKLEMETFEESRMHHLLCQSRPQITDDTVGTLVTVSKSTFSSRFSEYCHHMLDGMCPCSGRGTFAPLPASFFFLRFLTDVTVLLMLRSELEGHLRGRRICVGLCTP